MNYNGKVFKPVSNSGNILTAEYSGGKITKGHLIGLVNTDGTIDMRYHQVNTNGELMTGICKSTPKVLINGKVLLYESWEWTSGDFTKGESILEEV